jgi:hypothetical protein
MELQMAGQNAALRFQCLSATRRGKEMARDTPAAKECRHIRFSSI